jgi:hypothetical protein
MVRDITKTFLFPKCRYHKVFFTLGFKNYGRGRGRDGR